MQKETGRWISSKLKQTDIGLVAMITLLTYPVINFLMENWVIAALVSAAIACFLSQLKNRYIARLNHRMGNNQEIQWQCDLNGINIGSISDAQYAQIRLKVFTDKVNYWTQFRNLFRVLLRVVDHLFIVIPVATFWIVIGLAIFSPNSFNDIYVAYQASSPAEVAKFIKFCFQLMVTSIILYIAFSIQFGSKFGYVNAFSAATSTELRKHFGQTAEGDFQLTRWAGNTFIMNNEMSHIRK